MDLEEREGVNGLSKVRMTSTTVHCRLGGHSVCDDWCTVKQPEFNRTGFSCAGVEESTLSLWCPRVQATDPCPGMPLQVLGETILCEGQA